MGKKIDFNKIGKGIERKKKNAKIFIIILPGAVVGMD